MIYDSCTCTSGQKVRVGGFKWGREERFLFSNIDILVLPKLDWFVTTLNGFDNIRSRVDIKSGDIFYAETTISNDRIDTSMIPAVVSPTFFLKYVPLVWGRQYFLVYCRIGLLLLGRNPTTIYERKVAVMLRKTGRVFFLTQYILILFY